MIKLFFILMFVVSSIRLNAQTEYSIKTESYYVSLKTKLVKTKIKSEITIINLDSTGKYLAFDNGKLLYNFNEYFFKNKILEYFIGTCNEHRFPLYYCVKDSVDLVFLEKNGKLVMSFESDLRWANKKTFERSQINLIFRYINASKIDRQKSLDMKTFLKQSEHIMIELNKEKSIDDLSN